MPRNIKSGLIQMSLPMTEGEGTIPIYRFKHDVNKDHLYTKSKKPKAKTIPACPENEYILCLKIAKTLYILPT